MAVADDRNSTPRSEGLSSRERPGTDTRRRDLADWSEDERRRVLAIFSGEVYGHAPEVDVGLSWRTLRETPGPAGSVRRQISLELRPRARDGRDSSGVTGHRVDDCEPARLTLLVQVPGTDMADGAGSAPDDVAPPSGPVPAFLGLNFRGNHTLTEDPAVLDAEAIAEIAGSTLDYEGRISAEDAPPRRGSNTGAWAADLIGRRGYATITASYLEIGPDTRSIFATGLHPCLSSSGFVDRPASSWGAITLWAWVLQRTLDALEQGMVPEVDASRVIIHGHSRLGKTALWAAAQDERFAAAISNDSGCMGAAIDRGVGESHEVITTAFPHWFAPGFVERIAGGRAVPVDQHQLLATIAPRPLYVASASEDLHADPEGEFLAWKLAAEAWGADAAELDFPSPDEATRVPRVPLEYHLRRGEHSVQRFDWEHWLDFADRWVRTG